MMALSWGSIAECLALVSAVVLWRQAYRASAIKIARNAFELRAAPSTSFEKLKHWLANRQEKRDREWTEADHLWLVTGLGLGVLASVIRLLMPNI